ncbi:MAG: hypothetical protein ACI8PB_001200 [Desulforhopalus sp.]|jgi:hypothetical protein
MNKSKPLILFTTLVILSSCATSKHGTFVASTYVDPAIIGEEVVGKVSGESKQTWLLYIFPIGKAPSTDEAIMDAKSKVEDTKYLTDLSIDDRTYWGFGYSEYVIEVKATASK